MPKTRTAVRQVASSSIAYGVGDAFGQIIILIGFVIASRILSVESIGQLEMILSSVVLGGVVVGFALSSGVQRFYWNSGITQEEKGSLVTTGFIIQLSFSVLTIVLVSIFLGTNKIFSEQSFLGEQKSWWLLGFAWMIVYQCQTYLADLLRLKSRTASYVLITLSGRIITGSAILLFSTLNSFDIGLVIVSYIIGTVIPVLVLTLFVSSEFSKSFEIKWVKRLLSYCYPLVLSALGFWIYSFIDRWMISWRLGDESLGKYSVAVRIASVVYFLTAAFSQAWSPYAFKLNADSPEKFKDLSIALLQRIISALTLVAGFVSIFGQEIIYVIFGDKYSGVAPTMAILVWAGILPAIDQVFAVNISIAGRTKVFLLATWVGAGANIILNLVFLQLFSEVGAAIATLASLLIVTFIYYKVSIGLMPISLKGGWFLAVLLSSVLLIALNLLVFQYSEAGSDLFAKVLLACLATIISLAIYRKTKPR